MLVSKRYINVVGASLMHGLLLADPSIDGPLVQWDDSMENQICVQSMLPTDNPNTPQPKICVNPIMTPDLVDDLHQLIKRSYRITDRKENEYDYSMDKIMHGRVNRMIHINKVARESFTNKWVIHRPFTGIHGSELSGLAGALVRPSIETDYQGFVAYLAPNEERKRPPIIAIVYRGSQSKSFQRLNGILGPSWLTNFSAEKMAFPKITSDPTNPIIAGTLFHKGFLEKYLSGRLNVFSDIEEVWINIPDEWKSETRFIITGHSQGGAVVIPAALDIVNFLGKRFFGSTFSNINTPRFFVYALSGPNPVGDMRTKEIINQIVGRDNIIRHNSIFDIVTYACLGKNYDTWISKAIFGTAGFEVGYHPVGHLAIDDIKQLFERGLTYIHKDESLKNMDSILKIWSGFYSEAVKKHRADSCLKCFYHAILKWSIGAKGLNAMNGIYSFICINHYGSITANIDCIPTEEAKTKHLSMTNIEDSEPCYIPMEVNDTEKHGASFDPRLPECCLTPCLIRGEIHRNYIKSYTDFPGPQQVFNPNLIQESNDFFIEYDSEEYNPKEDA